MASYLAYYYQYGKVPTAGTPLLVAGGRIVASKLIGPPRVCHRALRGH